MVQLYIAPPFFHDPFSQDPSHVLGRSLSRELMKHLQTFPPPLRLSWACAFSSRKSFSTASAIQVFNKESFPGAFISYVLYRPWTPFDAGKPVFNLGSAGHPVVNCGSAPSSYTFLLCCLMFPLSDLFLQRQTVFLSEKFSSVDFSCVSRGIFFFVFFF